MPPTTVKIANGIAIGMYWVKAAGMPATKPRLGMGKPTGKLRVGGGSGCCRMPNVRMR
jgi:hypothetical protein